MVALIATRNVVAHNNRSLINRRCLQPVNDATFQERQQRTLRVDEFIDAMYLFREVVAKADEVASTKFDLSTYRLREETEGAG
jgi:hypothetical protein